MSKINIGAWVVGLFTGATGVLVGAANVVATIINVVAIVGLNLALAPRNKFGRSSSAKRELAGRTLNSRGPIESRQYIYGEVKVGGQIVFMETTGKDVGTDNKYLHIVIVHSSHEVEEIGDLYLGDEKVDLEPFVSEGTVRDPISSSKYFTYLKVYDHYGADDQTYNTALASFSSKWNTDHHLKGMAYTYLRFELDVENNVFPSGVPTISRVIKGKKIYDPRPITITGATQADPVVVTAVGHGMTSGDLAIHDSVVGMTELNGTTYSVTRLTDDTYEVDGLDGTGFTAYSSAGNLRKTSYSNNAALCSGDYIISENGYGRQGAVLADISVPEWIAAADVCDDPITLNTRPWETGKWLRPGVTRTSDTAPVNLYTSILGGGPTGSTAPTGTGTGIDDGGVLWDYVSEFPPDELRYTLNGAIQSDEDPIAITQKMRTAFAGFIEYIGGKWIIHAGEYRTPTVSLDSTNLAGSVSGATKDDRRASINRIKGVFANRLDGFNVVEFPAVVNATYLAEDNNVKTWRDLDLRFTTSEATAQRLAKIELEKARQQITHTAQFSLAAMELQAGDVFNFTFSKYGYSSKPFMILTHRLMMTTDGALVVEMNFRETASTIYDWNNGEETIVDPAPNTNLPNPFTVSAPAIGTLASGTAQLIIGGDGSIISRIYVPFIFGTEGHVLGHEMQWIVSTDSFSDPTEVNSIYLPGPSAAHYISGVDDALSYIVRVRAVTGIAKSEWSTSPTHDVVGKESDPDQPTGLSAVAKVNAVELTVDAATEPDFRLWKVYKSTSNTQPGAHDYTTRDVVFTTPAELVAGTQYYFWYEALDTTGHSSPATASVSATPTALPDSGILDIGAEKILAGTITNKILEIEGPTSGAAGGIIRSKNYDENVDGWKIESDGSVEFNNGTFRGDLVAGTINISDNFTVTATGVITIGNKVSSEYYFEFIDGDVGKIEAFDDVGASTGYWKTISGFESEIKLRKGLTASDAYAKINSQGLVDIHTDGTIDDSFNVHRDVGTTNERFNIGITNTGVLEFGLSATRDCNLYRDSADVLKTDDSFIIGGNLTLSSGAIISNSVRATTTLYVGSTADAGFERESANLIRTLAGDSLHVSGGLTVGASSLIGEWSVGDTDIDALIGGSTFGTLIEGRLSGHLTMAVRGNDTSDGFSVIKDTNNAIGRGSYDALLFTVDSVAASFGSAINLTVNGDITATGNLKADLYHSTLNDGYAYFRYGSGTIVDFQLRVNSGNLEYSTDATNWNVLATV